MDIGIPREIKTREHRVALTPEGARLLCQRGHRVLVQRGAGEGSSFADAAYADAGAELVDGADAVFARAELVLKVKEPLEAEWPLLRRGQMLFTYLHLAANPQVADALLASGCSALAYETVRTAEGRLPLLLPMSQVAGRMAVQAGAHYLQKHAGGRGVLLAGVPGVRPARVVVLGGGVVGSNAARIALGMGADVSLLDVSADVLGYVDARFGGAVRTVYSTPPAVEAELNGADLLVGAVLVLGARAPRLVTRPMLEGMADGAVAVDVAIDQGGCLETSRPTSHDEPTYVEGGVVHYCVTNMPGAVPRTATLGLTNATLPYVLRLAEHGLAALDDDSALAAGLNVHAGAITHPAVAEALGRPVTSR